jgi:hypothetical protein
VSPAVAAALEAVALRLGEAGIPFLLGGSALLHALGVPVAVGDLDLVLRPEDHDRLREAAGAWWRGSTTETTELFRSPWKATLGVDGVEVDALGGLAWAADGGRVARMPFRAHGTWRCGRVDIPLSSAAAWLALYERYRPDRAAALAPRVGAHERELAERELGLL